MPLQTYLCNTKTLLARLRSTSILLYQLQIIRFLIYFSYISFISFFHMMNILSEYFDNNFGLILTTSIFGKKGLDKSKGKTYG